MAAKSKNKVTLTRRAKIGLNRGKARLWLEGQWLAEAGFKVGTKFTAEITGRTITLRAGKNSNAELLERTVSGKGEKPIIDINTDILTQIAPAQSYITLQVSKGILVGQPEVK